MTDCQSTLLEAGGYVGGIPSTGVVTRRLHFSERVVPHSTQARTEIWGRQTSFGLLLRPRQAECDPAEELRAGDRQWLLERSGKLL